ncbi:hypothetical protein Ddc_19147 [Ditylenchus destructor]|nr:hypothetical protein Ddc_19147 [Ditylenchus destructor]
MAVAPYREYRENSRSHTNWETLFLVSTLTGLSDRILPWLGQYSFTPTHRTYSADEGCTAEWTAHMGHSGHRIRPCWVESRSLNHSAIHVAEWIF